MFTPVVDRIILHPSTQQEDAGKAERKRIAFEGGSIEIIVAESRGATTRPVEAIALSFVGNAARAEWMAELDADLWADRPVEVWCVNYPGYGNSTGPARLSRLAAAGMAAYGAVSQQANGRPIYVMGSSLGTTLALHVAARRSVAGVVLQNPPPLRELILGHYGWWNLWLMAGPVSTQIPSELDSLANAKSCTARAAIFMSENDKLVPVKFQRRVAEAYGAEHRVWMLPGADHNDLAGQYRVQMVEAMDWLCTPRPQ